MDRYEFIWKAIQKHGYKYDYRKVEYINNKTKVCIICPEHGEFWQRPDAHLYQNQNCPICEHRCKKYTTEEFIKKARDIHGDKYDYSKVNYKINNIKVCIICPKHGEFWQTPDSHINKKTGCPKCANRYETSEEFIEKAKTIHGDKYDYSKVKYIDSKTAICVICPKHGEFWQKPVYHLQKNGCPKCNESHLESDMRILLEENDIKYEYQKKFDWLGRQSLDFYLPDYNIAIECQGRQHFEPVKQFGGIDEYKKTIKRDKEKYKKCILNNITLLYYTNNENGLNKKEIKTIICKNKLY